MDQNGHKSANIALSSQAKACTQLKCSTSDHALYFFLIRLKDSLIRSWIGGSTIFSTETVCNSITEPLHIFAVFISTACECPLSSPYFLQDSFVLYTNIPHPPQMLLIYMNSTRNSFIQLLGDLEVIFLALTVSHLNCFRFSKHYQPPSSGSLWFEKLLSERQPLILLISHARPIKQSLKRSQKPYSNLSGTG